MSPTLLIIDDEALFREDLAHLLRRQGFVCHTAGDGEEGLEKAVAQAPDIILSDIVMPGKSGLELVADLTRLHPDGAVMMMTAYGSLDTAVAAFRNGAVDYILKPLDMKELEHKLKRILTRKGLLRELRYLRQTQEKQGAHGMVGHSPAVQTVLNLIAQVAPTSSNVLITGESGTGKELVARAIVNQSARAREPFVALNCAGFSQSLLESELFGHRKGAFTGAVEPKDGFFTVAASGTLFLDEISELPLSVQGKLLRVLEARTFYPVGSTTKHPFAARLITATNQDLTAARAAGRFREDLYYRIAVFEIPLPPLRKRREDIPLLAEHFLRTFSREMNRPVRGFRSRALQALMAYDWPGNIRELRNVMERAVILCQEADVDLHHLPPEMQRGIDQNAESDALHTALRAYEKRHIQQVLEACDGDSEAAARRLKIHRSTLYRKLKES